MPLKPLPNSQRMQDFGIGLGVYMEHERPRGPSPGGAHVSDPPLGGVGATRRARALGGAGRGYDRTASTPVYRCTNTHQWWCILCNVELRMAENGHSGNHRQRRSWVEIG